MQCALSPKKSENGVITSGKIEFGLGGMLLKYDSKSFKHLGVFNTHY